jgi:hypothetical protein
VSYEFPTKSIDPGTASEVIDWLGRISLIYSISKPILDKIRKHLKKPKGISFWDGRMDTLAMLTSRDGNPVLIKEEQHIVCLSCLSKPRRGIYCLFEDKESEEIVPICSKCFREMTRCKKRGKELMTEGERRLWNLKRLGPLMGGGEVEKALEELNARKYSHRDIRKKFLKRIKFPMDAVTYLPD